jgi:hypothetical protein
MNENKLTLNDLREYVKKIGIEKASKNLLISEQYLKNQIKPRNEKTSNCMLDKLQIILNCENGIIEKA